MTTATTTSGLRLDASGLSVAVASAEATAIDLCLDTPGGRERRYPLERAGDAWLGHVEGVREGDRYGLRAYGPTLDPSVAAASIRWRARSTDAGRWPSPTCRPLGAAARGRWAETVIYEAHVRGFTRLLPGVPPALRGTYAGLAHPAALAELVRLGITAIELLPVYEFRDEQHLVDRSAATTTGATARSASARRTPPTRRPAAAAARWPSSARSSPRCTPPASR